MLRPRSLLPALVAVAVAGVLGVGPAPALASPAGTVASGTRTQEHTQPLTRPLSKAQDAEPTTPLTVTIESLTPTVIPESGPIRVSGTVTNTDDVTWAAINVYAFVSDEPMRSTRQLAAAASTPEDAEVGRRITETGHYSTIAELAPRDSAPFSFSVPRRLLEVDRAGVYWFGVHALGESIDTPRDQFADGRARTFLPWVPTAAGSVDTSLVIPLRRAIAYAADGSVQDVADWTSTLSPGGRLRSLVDFGATSGDRTVSWAIDPALIDAVRRLAAGNPARSIAPNLTPDTPDGDPSDDPTDGASDQPSEASSGPPELESPAASPGEEASGSGDGSSSAPDPVEEPTSEEVLAAAAATSWLNRLQATLGPDDDVLTLPYGDVDVSAAATFDPGLYAKARKRSGTTLSSLDIPTSPVVASPSGFLDASGIKAVEDGTPILVTDQLLGPAGANDTPTVATVGGHRLVVASSGAAFGGPSPGPRRTSLALRQRILAEAAVRALSDAHRPLVVQFRADFDPTSLSGFFSGLDVPFVRLASLGDVADRPATTVRLDELRYPDDQVLRSLPVSPFVAAESLMRAGETLQNVLTLNDQVADTVSDQALTLTSYAARPDPDASRISGLMSESWIDAVLDDIHVDAPPAVTLSSETGKFTATIANDLDQPVTVRLRAVTDNRIRIQAPRKVVVGPGQRSTVRLTASTGENAVHAVTVELTDTDGTPIGASDELPIRSAQVSDIIWLFMAAGAALLFGAIGFRIARRVRRARRAPDGAEQPENAHA